MVDPLGLARNDNTGVDCATERAIEMSFRALSVAKGENPETIESPD
jgi:hypothetical protein